jgi:nitroreductase
MEFTELIRNRESIRNYDPEKPVPQKVLDKILEAGRIAPSACNDQPWMFLVIRSEQMLHAVRDCYSRPWFKEAPLVLVVVGLKDKAWVRSFDGYNSIETDVAIAFTHLMLAAENEGVGTCWIEAYDPKILRKALDLDESQVVFGITPLGYPKAGFVKKGEKIRKSMQEIVRFL